MAYSVKSSIFHQLVMSDGHGLSSDMRHRDSFRNHVNFASYSNLLTTTVMEHITVHIDIAKTIEYNIKLVNGKLIISFFLSSYK